MSLVHCLIGTLWSTLSYKASRDSTVEIVHIQEMTFLTLQKWHISAKGGDAPTQEIIPRGSTAQ